MWLIIRDSDNAVVGTNYDVAPTVPSGFTVKEWPGTEPPIHNPDEGIYSYDPTLTDPDYADFVQARLDLDDLATKADNEIVWLEATIPTIDTMTATQVRDVVKRLAQENLETIRAWRYVIRKLT